MDSQVREKLARIGASLDRRGAVRVRNGGFVVLNEQTVQSNQSTEISNGKAARRSAARPWPGPTRRQGAPDGPWTPGATTPVVGADLETRYEAELGVVCEQYPGAQFTRHEHGGWLLTNSGLLPGLSEHAIILTGISFAGRVVRSWAFWGHPIAYPVWIGPRHTNFPDGSICSYEPADGSWQFGRALVSLLDLHTVWAVRHLYLREFGRWPGGQSIHFPGERILEMRPDEQCSCADTEKLYRDCCMPRDLLSDRIAHCLDFHRQTGGFRQPPLEVVDFVRLNRGLPDLGNLVTAYAPCNALT
jgi:hypothetical protein